MSEAPSIRRDRRPGDDALVVSLHQRGYANEGVHFSPQFLDYVAHTLAEAGLDDLARGRIWFVERAGETLGCAALVIRADRGQLRWVVLAPEARGLGLGRQLVEAALDEARARGLRSVYLETTPGLEASMALYLKLGFIETARVAASVWEGGGEVVTMELPLL